jgi:hypothetical protein
MFNSKRQPENARSMGSITITAILSLGAMFASHTRLLAIATVNHPRVSHAVTRKRTTTPTRNFQVVLACSVR